MATPAARKRLTREYQLISQSPPPYIVAHPSEANILEWHYILTGPPQTPYEGGQYWGTLVFPSNYPFAPPAIRMHTPSGRFQPSTRLCLSISDFHPKSFNPAWEVSTILIGLLSFMTSDEMTTGSLSSTDQEKRLFASQTRWWNSTGGGSTPKTLPGISGINLKGANNVKAGDGGAKFHGEWPELDEANWNYLREKRIDPKSGRHVPDPLRSVRSPRSPMSPSGGPGICTPRTDAFGKHSVNSVVVEGGQNARQAGRGWVSEHKWLVAILAIFGWVMMARVLGEGYVGKR